MKTMTVRRQRRRRMLRIRIEGGVSGYRAVKKSNAQCIRLPHAYSVTQIVFSSTTRIRLRGALLGSVFDIYYQNIPPTLFFKSLRKIKNVVKFHDYALKFKKHAQKGNLPNYVVVEHRYFDVEVLPAIDDHPSHDVAEVQMFVKEVYEILRKSPQWKEMAMSITYDEHGGFYDHVATLVEGVPNPDGIIGPPPYYFWFDRLGVRVPTFLISPWIEKGTCM